MFEKVVTMAQPVVKLSLQHLLCSSTGFCTRMGALVTIIVQSISFTLTEHDTVEQFESEQVQNTLFLLIIPALKYLLMMTKTALVKKVIPVIEWVVV